MSTDVLAEALGELVTLLEADIPASPAAKKNEPLEAGLKSDLKGYFNDVEQAIPQSELTRLYYKWVAKE